MTCVISLSNFLFLNFVCVGFDSVTVDHPDHPHHTGIPHWVDDCRTTAKLLDRVKSGWLQVGWGYTTPANTAYTNEIYQINDMDMYADEQDLESNYERVNVAEEYNWDVTGKYN